MYRVNNDNVNVVRTSNYNVNDNGNKYDKSKSVDLIADKLMQRLGCTEKSRPFLLKAGWKLSEAKLWDNVEQALKGRNPMGLFIFLCKKDGL